MTEHEEGGHGNPAEHYLHSEHEGGTFLADRDFWEQHTFNHALAKVYGLPEHGHPAHWKINREALNDPAKQREFAHEVGHHIQEAVTGLVAEQSDEIKETVMMTGAYGLTAAEISGIVMNGNFTYDSFQKAVRKTGGYQHTTASLAGIPGSHLTAADAEAVLTYAGLQNLDPEKLEPSDLEEIINWQNNPKIQAIKHRAGHETAHAEHHQ